MPLPMTIERLMEQLGFKDVGQNKNNQFGKTYRKVLAGEEKFSLRGHHKNIYFVTLEFSSEDEFNKFNPSDFRASVENRGQACEFYSNEIGEDDKKNVIFKITIYNFIK